jgi:hypothetical protein
MKIRVPELKGIEQWISKPLCWKDFKGKVVVVHSGRLAEVRMAGTEPGRLIAGRRAETR